MWVMTETGFVSIVEKPEDQDRGTLTVRARDVEHLVKFIEGTGGEYDLEQTIIESEGTDYPYRAVLGREVVANAMWNAALDIDYVNFKSRAKVTGGTRYERFLMKVWAAGLSLTSYRDEKRLNLLYSAEDFGN